MPDRTDHPQLDRLRRLLLDEEGLTPAEQSELAVHLERCPDCCRTLQEMAARSGDWSDLRRLREGEELDPPGLVAKGASPLGISLPDGEAVPLGLLEPPTGPGHLGRLGAYDVLDVIGRGGMGIVFQARDRARDRLVAIKVLTPGLAATAAARRRFAREARAAAAVVNEHVVAIHAVDVTEQGVPYLVMQYVPGRSVQDLVDRGEPPQLPEILRIGMQAARALAAAHAQGLIHRDVKPANILLENGVERVKITDFGLARAVDDATMTESGVVAGTPQYMAPEQARGDAIDHRADLFSLGSVLYALCTGRAPFRSRSSLATLKQVCEEAPPPVGSFNPEIPRWLIRIIDRLHAKDPAGRYASAGEVADLLGCCLAHVQQPATVPFPAELAPRSASPRRGSATPWAIAACLLLGVVSALAVPRGVAEQVVDYVATVLRLKTPEGVLVIETDDPNVGIRLDGSDLTVTGAGVKELRLPVGPHNVQAVKEGRTLREELVTIARGRRKVLSIRREAERPEPGPPVPAAVPASAPGPATRTTETFPGSRSNRRDRGPALRPDLPRPTTPSRPAGGPRLASRITQPRAVLQGNESEVRSVTFSPDGALLAAGAKDGTIRVWKVEPSHVLGEAAPIVAHERGVESVAFAPDGKALASGGWDHHVRLWDFSPGPSSIKPLWDFPGHADGVRAVAFRPDGNRLAAGGFDRVVTVIQASTALREWTSPVLDQPVNGVQFSPDGRFLALALGDYSKGTPGDPNGQPGEVQVWDYPMRQLRATLRGWTRECKSVAFSPDGALLAATSGDGTTRLYDGTSFHEKAVLPSGPFTAGLAFRPDSRTLATSNWSGRVVLWEPATGQPRESFQAHDQNIPSLTFSPDGRTLATASADGSIKLWDVGATTIVSPPSDR